MKTGIAEASKNSKKAKMLVQLNAPIKHTSINKNNVNINWEFADEYQDVSTAIIRIKILKIIKGRFKLWCNSNQELAG